jgi:thioredoxin reductase
MKVKNIIIGAGPAGIQMADLLKDEEYIILEKADVPCSFFHKFPRHRKFISFNKGENLRNDWNSFLGGHLSFRKYSEEMYPHVDDYLRYVNDFIKLRELKITFNFEVKSIEKKDDLFYINGGEYISERVFFGIGIVHKQPIVPISPKTSHLKIFTYANMPLEKDIYRDKNIMIIGSGNAAFETIKWMEPFTNKIKVMGGSWKKAWQTHYPGHLRSVNFQSIDSFFLKQSLLIHWETDANRICDRILDVSEYDVVIFCHGFKFDSKIVKNLVDVDIFPILTPNFESTKCKNLFFIGSNSQQHDYKKGTSAFIHGFRYNCQYISRYLKKELNFKTLTTRLDLIHHILRDVNTSSALLHRFEYFCILIGFTSTGYQYISEIPLSSASEHVKQDWKTYATVRFGYNTDVKYKDTFIPTNPAFLPKDAHLSEFIHVIIQTREGAIMRLPENPFLEFYSENYHVKPLNLYLDVIEGLKTSKEVDEIINRISTSGEKITDFLRS